MTKTQAMSKVFVTAYRSLSRQERISILQDLLETETQNEISDIVLALQRRREKPLLYESVRSELKKTRRL